MLFSRVSSFSELSSSGTLKDLSKGYLEPPSKIEFGVGVFIKKKSIVDLMSDL